MWLNWCKKYLESDKKYYLADLSFRLSGLCSKNADYGHLYEKKLFSGAEEFYPEGTEVEISYSLIATDTDYTFYVDGQVVRAEWNDKKGYIIRFIMPAHDIEVYCVQRNTMKNYY